MTSAIPSSVVMVRPSHFGFNAETAVNNAFQNKIEGLSKEEIQDKALHEFDAMVNHLRLEGIEVIVFEDMDDDTPDSIFPNNWFSTFTDEVVLYPMFTPNRRKERKEEIYHNLSERTNKPINTQLLAEEVNSEILEGTGSLVCDYTSKTAFAALSPRTTKKALEQFEKLTGYDTVSFNAYGPDGNLIYHTNVMMTMGDDFVILGTDSIEESEQQEVIESLNEIGKEIIDFSNDQIFNQFAGNMLQLANADGDKYLVMSSLAYEGLTEDQKNRIEDLGNTIIAPSIPTIETIGGGSVRCMMAELFYD